MDIQAIYEAYLKHPIVTTDSRNCPKGSLFFALKGENFNGNKFAAQALAKGCSYAVVDDATYASTPNIFVVKSVLNTLTKLANHHRKVLNKPVIAITGTNGKTTTKELIDVVLQGKYRVCATQGNFNNHIGVPLTLLRANKEHDFILTEMGANHTGEIAHLCTIAEPNFGLITNIGKAHLEGFGSYKNIIKTKGELYDFIKANEGTLFINNDDTVLNNIAIGTHKINYGSAANFNLALTKQSPYLELEYSDPTTRINTLTHFIGDYNLINFKAAICVGKYFNIDAKTILHQIESYVPSNNRSQLTQTKKNKVIQDAYNANPSSVGLAIHNFVKLDTENKWVILGDMKELGAQSQLEHQQVVNLLCEQQMEQVFLIGEEFYKTNTPEHFIKAKNLDEAKHLVGEKSIEGALILVKGSRSMKLEQIVEYI